MEGCTSQRKVSFRYSGCCRRRVRRGQDGRGASDYEFTGIKCFRISAGGVAFHASQPHQGKEGFALEPVLPKLGLKAVHKELYLRFAHLRRQRDEYFRLPHIPVIFWYLVLQDQVIPEGVPCQFRDHTVVLMGVPSIMGQDEVWRNKRLQVLECLFDFGSHKRHEAVPECLKYEILDARWGYKGRRRFPRLLLARPDSAEDHPMEDAV